MPVYSVNRRRAIILLVLTSVLLLTLDVRGNAVVNRVRSVFVWALSPFVTAGDVIATPIKHTWHGATDYEDLKRENEELREQIAQQRGDQLTARAIVSDYQELLTLNGLIANYPRVTARVVGGRTSNFRQTVDIDRGSDDGILTGMAVINSAGLVGKVTQVYEERSVVLLVTDQEYTIECKVVGSAPPPDAGTAATDADATDDADNTDDADTTDDSDSTDETAPSGVNVEDLATTTSPSTTTTTTIADTDASDPDEPAGSVTTTTDAQDAATASGTGTTSTTSATTTTTTVLVQRETGGCGGRGADKLPVMRFVTEDPRVGPIEVGDVISTAGGSRSLVPPNLVIGTVINKINRASSAGPLLEIELNADLDHLSLVQIVRFQPTSEIPD